MSSSVTSGCLVPLNSYVVFIFLIKKLLKTFLISGELSYDKMNLPFIFLTALYTSSGETCGTLYPHRLIFCEYGGSK